MKRITTSVPIILIEDYKHDLNDWKNILLCYPAGDGARDSGHGEPRADHHAGAGGLLAGLQTHHQVKCTVYYTYFIAWDCNHTDHRLQLS